MSNLGMPKVSNPMKINPPKLENPVKRSEGKNVHIAKLVEKINRKF